MTNPHDPEIRLKSLSPAPAGEETRRRVIGAVERRYRESRVLSPPLRWAAVGCVLMIGFALSLDSAAGRGERIRLADLGLTCSAGDFTAVNPVGEPAVDIFGLPAERWVTARLKWRFRRRNPAMSCRVRKITGFEEEIDEIQP